MPGRFQNINYELDSLPTMPVVAAQMIELINSPNTSASQLANVVSKDATVAARVLKIANSSFYSMSRQVATLSTAIVILGERTLKNLVLAASMRGMHLKFGALEQMLWEDSMICALGSRFLARRLYCSDPEEAFMAGLFRHIGKVVLSSQLHQADRKFLEQMVRAETAGQANLERQVYGASHAEVGAAVLEHWKMSEDLCLVALHHGDGIVPEEKNETVLNLVSLVNIANEFSSLFGLFGQPRQVDLGELPGAVRLRLKRGHLEELVDEFRGVFAENRESFLGT